MRTNAAHPGWRGLLAAALLALVLLSGCGDDGGGTPVAPDLDPPEVVSANPADGAVGFPASSTVWFAFDEPIALADTAAALTVRGPLGLVGGDVALDSTATVISFTPYVPFTIPADFTATLAAGIADQAGNARPDSLVVRFTTALALHEIGRFYCANAGSNSLTVLDVNTYEEVEESPVPLAGSPRRLRAERGEGVVYVLYIGPFQQGAGVLVVDGRSLMVLRDSGLVLPSDAADLAVSPEHQRVFVVAPGAPAVHILDATTLAVAAPPLVFDRPDADPVRVEVARTLGILLVALDGGAALAGFRLPGLEVVQGFPAESAPYAHSILVDEPRGRAWVGGAQRYAVVDLIAPERTVSFQMPACSCDRLWSMILSPVRDRVYFIGRYNHVLAVRASDLAPVPESPGQNLFRVLGDLAENPRTGDLLVLSWRNLETPVVLVSWQTLSRLNRPLPLMENNALDLEVLP